MALEYSGNTVSHFQCNSLIDTESEKEEGKCQNISMLFWNADICSEDNG